MGLEKIMQHGAGDGCRSNPNRDIAHFWPRIVQLIGPGLRRDLWEPWFVDYLKIYPITEDQLFLALACLYNSLVDAIKPEMDHPLRTVTESGFLATPPPAQLVVLSKLGQLTYGAFWSGIKSANPLGTVPEDLLRLERGAEEMLRGVRKAWRAPDLWKGVVP